MANLVMTTFLTLDGVMQAPGAPNEDPSGAFTHGGWLVPHADADMGAFITDIFAEADAFLLGRKTYEIFAAYWPRVTDPANAVAGALNELPKYVASKTLDKVEWNNSKLVRDLVDDVARLKREYAREVQVHGSCGLAQSLIENDLVDEYHLLLFPVVLGTGKRLFGSGTVPRALKLTGTKTTSTRVLINTYRRAGRPTYGSFALDQ